MSIFPGKTTLNSRKSGIIKKRVVWTRDGGYVAESTVNNKGWILCPRSKETETDFGRLPIADENEPEPALTPLTISVDNDVLLPAEGAEGGDYNVPLIVPGASNLIEIRQTPLKFSTEHDNGGEGDNGNADRNGRGNGNGNGDGNGNGNGGDYCDGGEDQEMIQVVAGDVEIADGSEESGHGSGSGSGSGKSAEPESIPSTSSGCNFEPIAGPSGINVGASTSGLNLPSSFEDEEEGKRPRKKVCAQIIDYGDYDFDDDDYNYGYAHEYNDYDFDDDDDPNNNNNNDFGTPSTARPTPLLHHSYTRSHHYYTGEPRGNISQADWNEAGPSGINVGASTSGLNLRYSRSDMSSVPPPLPPPGLCDPDISNDDGGDTDVNAQQTSAPSDSDISSSCSHRSLVDRYTHMNISGCEDQTDEECAFDESDDQLEED